MTLSTAMLVDNLSINPMNNTRSLYHDSENNITYVVNPTDSTIIGKLIISPVTNSTTAGTFIQNDQSYQIVIYEDDILTNCSYNNSRKKILQRWRQFLSEDIKLREELIFDDIQYIIHNRNSNLSFYRSLQVLCL